MCSTNLQCVDQCTCCWTKLTIEVIVQEHQELVLTSQVCRTDGMRVAFVHAGWWSAYPNGQRGWQFECCGQMQLFCLAGYASIGF